MIFRKKHKVRPMETILEAIVEYNSIDEDISIVRVELTQTKLPDYLKDYEYHWKSRENPLDVTIVVDKGITCLKDSVMIPLKVEAPVVDSILLKSLDKAEAYVTHLRLAIKGALENLYQAPVTENWNSETGHLSYTREVSS